MLNTGAQGAEFLSAVYAGLIIGLFYEVCRQVRRAFRDGKAAGIVCDTVFWAGTGVIFFIATYIINGARFRFYLLLGAAAGLVLHFYSIGIIINNIIAKIRRRRLRKCG